MEPWAKTAVRTGAPLILMAALLTSQPLRAELSRPDACVDQKDVGTSSSCREVNAIAGSGEGKNKRTEADGAVSMAPVAPETTKEIYGD